jgi:hypothetical protein
MTNRVSQRPPGSAAFDRSGDSAETPASTASTAQAKPSSEPLSAAFTNLSGFAKLRSQAGAKLAQADAKLLDAFKRARMGAKPRVAHARSAAKRFFGFPRPLGTRLKAGWNYGKGGYAQDYSSFMRPGASSLLYLYPLMSGVNTAMMFASLASIGGLTGFGVMSGLLGVAMTGGIAYAAGRRLGARRTSSEPDEGPQGEYAQNFASGWEQPEEGEAEASSEPSSAHSGSMTSAQSSAPDHAPHAAATSETQAETKSEIESPRPARVSAWGNNAPSTPSATASNSKASSDASTASTADGHEPSSAAED